MDFVTDVKKEDEKSLCDSSLELLYPKIELEVKKECKQKDLICYVCGRTFGIKGDLSKHISRIHLAVAGSKICDLCAKTFKNHGDLYHHKAQVHTNEILKCERCFVDCKNNRALRKHVAKCSKRDVPLPIHHCTFCTHTFSLHKTLYIHLKQQHNHVAIKCCDLCGKTFAMSSSLIRHKKTVHKISKTEDNNAGLTTTDVYKYNASGYIDSEGRHVDGGNNSVNIQSGENVYEGTIDTSESGALEVPTNEYSNETKINSVRSTTDPINEVLDYLPYYDSPFDAFKDETIGQVCEENIERMDKECGTLKIKEEVPSVLQSVPKSECKNESKTGNLCGICAKLFPNTSLLRKHMMTAHIKPEDGAACDICFKTFRAKHLVQHHVREVHSTELFFCDVCGKTFCSKANMKRHLERHTTEKIHPCQLCNKSFSNKNYLRHHHKEVHEIKDNPCDKCGKMYKNKYLLRKHVNKYHIS